MSDVMAHKPQDVLVATRHIRRIIIDAGHQSVEQRSSKMIEFKSFLVLLLAAGFVASNEDCYANRTDAFLLFATKTSYFQVGQIKDQFY